MLTLKEIDILRWLAIGYSYTMVSERVKSTEACVYVHCGRIRKKTGLDTKDRLACARFLQEHPEIRERSGLPTVPTPRQLLIMEFFAEGKSYDYIANSLRIGKQTVINQLSTARKRAGIVSSPFSDRTKEVREYLARRTADGLPPVPPTMADPAFS